MRFELFRGRRRGVHVGVNLGRQDSIRGVDLLLRGIGLDAQNLVERHRHRT